MLLTYGFKLEVHMSNNIRFILPVLCFSFAVSAHASDKFYYITPDYHAQEREGLKEGVEKPELDPDFPGVDPSSEKSQANASELAEEYADFTKQSSQVKGNLFPILVGNVFTTPSRRALAERLTLLAQDTYSGYPLKSLRDMLPNHDHAFAIANVVDEFEDFSDFSFGLCWAVTGTLRKFVMLSLFDPTQRAPFDRVTQKDQYLDFYFNKIEQVIALEPTVFPGFKDLRDLTSEPEFEYYLKSRVTEAWKSYMKKSSFLRNLNLSPQTTIMNVTMEATLPLLKHNLFPKWFITSPGKREKLVQTYKHVIMPIRAEKDEEGHTVVYTWDPDFYADEIQKHPTFVIRADEDYVYSKWTVDEVTPLVGLEFPPEEYDELSKIVSHAKTFCKKSPEKCRH